MPPPHLFDDFLIHRSIHLAVFSECTPASLICFSKTCHAAQYYFGLWMKIAYNVNHLLRPYFHNDAGVLQFRQLQVVYSLIVSGSSALQFFDRTLYPNSDLDIYVENKFSHAVGMWLIRHGYVFTPQHGQAETFTEQFNRSMMSSAYHSTGDVQYRVVGVSVVFNMSKGTRRLQLVGCVRSPLHTVLGFHSTCVMNFIAYNAAYSLYPTSTYETRESLIVLQPFDLHERQSAAREKYSQRGWKFIQGCHETLSSSTRIPSAFGGMGRYVGDRYTWTIPLDIDGIEVPNFMMAHSDDGPSTPGSVFTANSWRLCAPRPALSSTESQPLSSSRAIAACSSSIFRCDGLKFTYMVSDLFPKEFFRKAGHPILPISDFFDADFDKATRVMYLAWSEANTP